MQQKTESLKVNELEAKRVLTGKGFDLGPDLNEYVSWKGSKDDVTAIYYSSGKLVLQGKGDVDSVFALFEKGVGGKDGYEAHIGSDEVGKGDYFGPLVVAACYVDGIQAKKLAQMGVKDSKAMSDEKIIDICLKIETTVRYKIRVIMPSEYNFDVEKVGNVSILLGKYHMDNVKALSEELEADGISCKRVIVDQFSKRKDRLSNEARGFELIQFHKGESDIAVAAASMLARRSFLEEMEDLKSFYKFDFPKGSSNVIEQAREFVAFHSAEKLREVAKVSFKTTQKVLFSLS